MYCYSVTKQSLKRTKIDRKIKLLVLTLLNSKNKHVQVVPAILNKNTYVLTPKQLNLS